MNDLPQVCELADQATGLAINDTDIVFDLDVLREKLRTAAPATPI